MSEELQVPGSRSRSLLHISCILLSAKQLTFIINVPYRVFIGLLHKEKVNLSQRAMCKNLNIEFQISLPPISSTHFPIQV